MSSFLHHLLDICSASDIPNRLVFCELRSSETRAVVPLFDSAWGPRRNLWKVELPIKRLGRYASGQFLDRQKLPLCKRAVVFQAKADPNRTVWNDVTLAHCNRIDIEPCPRIALERKIARVLPHQARWIRHVSILRKETGDVIREKWA